MIMILLVVLCAAAGAWSGTREMVRGAAVAGGGGAWGWPPSAYWLAAAGPCWQHMAHAAVRAFCTTENDKNKKIKISGTPRALSSISFNNQLLILRTKNREAE